jgi:hypothetical protein
MAIADDRHFSYDNEIEPKYCCYVMLWAFEQSRRIKRCPVRTAIDELIPNGCLSQYDY